MPLRSQGGLCEHGRMILVMTLSVKLKMAPHERFELPTMPVEAARSCPLS